MASSHAIRRVLLQFLSLSLTPLLGACGSAGAEINTDGFDAIPCNKDQGEPHYLANLKLAAASDYLELRVVADNPGAEPRTIDAAGDRCAKATDKAACEAKVAAATSSKGFQLGQCLVLCESAFLIVNSGDDVTVLEAKEDILSRLESVDAPADAVLLAALSGYSVGCGDVNVGGVRKSGSSFEVIAARFTSDCMPLEITQYRLQISADGSINESESLVVESIPVACM